MSNKITPGPWKAVEIDPPVGYAKFEIHYGDDGECVAEVVHVGADATLISAAPDLLEALQQISSLPEFKNLWSNTKQMVNNAIAKATGVF